MGSTGIFQPNHIFSFSKQNDEESAPLHTHTDQSSDHSSPSVPHSNNLNPEDSPLRDFQANILNKMDTDASEAVQIESDDVEALNWRAEYFEEDDEDLLAPLQPQSRRASVSTNLSTPPAMLPLEGPAEAPPEPMMLPLTEAHGSVEESLASAGSNSDKPRLYSAIGSLEHSYSNSLNLRHKLPKKFDFDTAHVLIPPNVWRSANKASQAVDNLQHKAETNSGEVCKGDEATSTARRVKQVGKTKRKEKRPEIFRPSSDAYTPRVGKKDLKFKPAKERCLPQTTAGLGTLQRPNFRDALKRVAMILYQHINKIEERFESSNANDKLFFRSMEDEFAEDRFVTPKYKCSMVRVPMARPGMVYGLKKIHKTYNIPTVEEIYDFACQLFDAVQLSSECSIVCLIYVERLMEASKVPLLATTWRPIFMCGLLMASKVWQDLSSWNVEFASVYPQFSVDAINRLELAFLKSIKWNLYISSSAYAKYYFALRSLLEKSDFRQRYNRLVMGSSSKEGASNVGKRVEERTALVKEEAIQLSQSYA